MINEIFLYISSALLIFWGAAHLVATRSVVKDFGDVSPDNKRIITMEWIMEGISLIFIGTIIATLTGMDFQNPVSRVVYLLCSGMLFVMALLSLFTGFKIKFLPFRLCPVIFISSAALIIIALFVL